MYLYTTVFRNASYQDFDTFAEIFIYFLVQCIGVCLLTSNLTIRVSIPVDCKCISADVVDLILKICLFVNKKNIQILPTACQEFNK